MVAISDGAILIILVMAVVAPLGLGFLVQALFRLRVIPAWVYWLLAAFWAGLLWIGLGCRLTMREGGDWAGGMTWAGPFEWTLVILGGFFFVALFVCFVGLFRAGGAFARGLLVDREDQT